MLSFDDIFSCLTCRIGSGKQVASVIVDDGKDQDDEDDTFVVEDAHAIQNDLDVVSSNAKEKNLPISPPQKDCSHLLVVLTPWILDMQLCTFLLNFAWLEAILKIKKQWIASKLTENVCTQKRGARFSAPAQSQHHA